MGTLVPEGYLTVIDALDRVGRELFPSEWTGEEQRARAGLPSEVECHKRYAAASFHLRVQLEAGRLEAVLLDPWKGTLHQAWRSLWRRHDADRMIARAEAPLPYSPNRGEVFIKQFGEPNASVRPMPEAFIARAIDLLKEKPTTETLTRQQKTDFVRQSFPDWRISERQMRQILKAVPTPIGRRRKSVEKV